MTSEKTARRAIIVGAGVGGLAAAIHIRAAGWQVLVLERSAAPGGKIREVRLGGQVFDTGPSVLTMPTVFDELFAVAGESRADWVRFVPLEPACRHFFGDGTVLDLYNDAPAEEGTGEPWERSAQEVARVMGPRAAEQFRRFRRHAARLYRAVERPFLQRAIPRNPLLLPFTHAWRDALGLASLDSRRSMWRSLEGFFEEERLRVLFARYATYCGSDPFLAPATLNVIPHVELAQGLHAVAGGMYRLAEALFGVCQKLGVQIQFGAEVEEVELCARGRRAVAVHAAGERISADAVVVNCDVRALARRLLAGTPAGARLLGKVEGEPASLSAYVHLVLQRRADPHLEERLCHHNVFFSADYRREFEALTQRGQVPEEPTVYLCTPDRLRWFLLCNAPPLPGSPEAEEAARERWQQEAGLCRQRIATQLARHGFELGSHAIAEQSVTPVDFAQLYPESRGSLYGAASNTPLSAFRRPGNRVRGVENLYCVGGSTHPGAGVPMVALSARISADLLLGRQRQG